MISVFFTLIGAGGATIFNSKLGDGWTSSKKKEVNSSPPTVPTQKPPEVTPKPESPPPIKTNIPALTEDSFSFETVKVNERGEVIKRESKATSMWIEGLGERIKLEMVYIPAGTFIMGSPGDEKGRQRNEEPRREVTIQPFLMGRYTVTQAQWRYVSTLPRVQIDLASDPSYFKGDLRPVERISWYEAREFCARLSKATNREYRLPSESEWEYACRAGTTTPFYFGETITTELANYDGSLVYGRGSKGIYREKTTEVETFPANAYGLFDMHGNIWEWCADHFHENYKRALRNETAWLSSDENARRVIRGGSWYSSPKFCRSANRTPLPPHERGDPSGIEGTGFRIVCVPESNLFQ